jgi:hypothetical protein
MSGRVPSYGVARGRPVRGEDRADAYTGRDGWLLVVRLVSSLLMVGMIWTVQLVHYPLMALVGPERFAAYEAAHAPRMAAVVLLPWTVQGLSTAWLLLAPRRAYPALIPQQRPLPIVPVIVTVLASVPAHTRLADGFDADVHAPTRRDELDPDARVDGHGVLAVAVRVTAG